MSNGGRTHVGFRIKLSPVFLTPGLAGNQSKFQWRSVRNIRVDNDHTSVGVMQVPGLGGSRERHEIGIE